METGSLVKAIHDFCSDHDDELPLQAGDIVLVTKKLDKQWCRGICNSREGNFPTLFTIDLKIPFLKENQQLFAPIANFVAQELGDLSFQKGDLVVGLRAIDSNWWEGELNGNLGIFPLTHVWKVDRDLVLKNAGPRKTSLKARVNMNVKAQLKEEIDLTEGEIVHITEIIDKSWYQGECNGRVGIFPSSFVTVLTNEQASQEPSSPLTNQITITESATANDAVDNQYGYDCLNSGIAAYGRTLYPFRAEYSNELSFSEGEIVSLIRHIDEKWIEGEIDGRVGIFPKDFINIIVDCPANENPVSENFDNNVFPPDTYGRVLCTYNPNNDAQAKLKEGDTVTLVRKIDRDWQEVMTDNGESFVYPASFLEVIGNGPDALPPSYSEVVRTGSYLNLSFGSDKGRNINTDLKTHQLLTSVRGERPSSYPSSSFDWTLNGPKASGRSEPTFKISQSIDDKIVENLWDLDSSRTSDSSGNAGNVSRSFSLSSNSSFSSVDKNSSYGEKRLSSSPCIAENGSAEILACHSNLSSEENNVPWEYESTTHSNSIAPARPPLPHGSRSEADRTNFRILRPPAEQQFNCNSIEPSTDVKQQLKEKENKLKKLSACKAKLEEQRQRSQNDGSFVDADMKDQISHLSEEIENLSQEIASLKKDLLTSEANAKLNQDPAKEEAVSAKKQEEEKRRAEERKKKMKEQRSCVITEILQTEKDYILDLKILYDTFLRNPDEGKAKGIDILTLFGNLDEVIDVASHLLQKLERTAKRSDNEQMIGECFVNTTEEMKEVYGHYCRNHDDINAVLDKYNEKTPGGQFLKHKVEILKRQTNCFDLPSMLIKPVQRILKYPLLLNELVKCTDDSHKDKKCLFTAIELMTDVATAINEFKRRKDLVFKYRKHADTSFSGRMSKFSIHSMLKKSSRFGMKLSNTIGLTSVTRDENFEKWERQFHSLEKTVKIFMKDINAYIEKTEELAKTSFRFAEDIAEFYGDRKNQEEVDKFRTVHRLIVTQYFEANKKAIEQNVLSVLKQMLQSYDGPSHLIIKRYDKLLDYESCTNKAEKNKDVTKVKMLQDNQQNAKNDYDALNAQLLDELPKLYSTSVEVLRDCIRCFLRTKMNFIGKSAREMLDLAELPLLLGSPSGGVGAILETFQVKHTLIVDNLCQMTIVPKQLFPSNTGTMKRNSSPSITRLSFGAAAHVAKLVCQSSSQKAFVKSSYPSSQLYNTCQDFHAVDILDLSVKKGDLVGVIKQQDPMGSRSRWFVDNGDAKGFVPAKILVKFLPDFLEPAGTPHNSTQHSSFGKGALMNQLSFSNSIPRNSKTRRSLPAVTLEKIKPQDGSLYANCSKPNSSLKPVRPAPPPILDVMDSVNATASSVNLVPQAVSNQTVPNKAESLNIASKTDEIQSHRYEEPDDLINQYDSVNEDNHSDQSQKSSNLSLEEFDPYAPLSPPKQLYDNVPSDRNSPVDIEGHRYEVIPEDSATDSKDTSEYYYALYCFQPSGPNQMSLLKGQVVLVLHKCDLNGNSEWWFVEDRHGNKGYVPGNYLHSYDEAVGHV